MKKNLLISAAIMVFAGTNTARAELLRYTLDVDSVYTSSARTTPIAYTGSGTNITLPAGTTSAYVTMAIVATVENPTAASNDISLDGFNMGILNIVANPLSGIGGATLATKFGKTASSAQQGPFINANDPNAAPAAGWNGQITGPASYTAPATLAATTLKGNWASPVQALYDYSSELSPPNKNYEWSTNFGSGLGAGTGVVSGSGLVIGKNGPYATKRRFHIHYPAAGLLGRLQPAGRDSRRPIADDG